MWINCTILYNIFDIFRSLNGNSSLLIYWWNIIWFYVCQIQKSNRKNEKRNKKNYIKICISKILANVKIKHKKSNKIKKMFFFKSFFIYYTWKHIILKLIINELQKYAFNINRTLFFSSLQYDLSNFKYFRFLKTIFHIINHF